jgi:hypothetical protein
MRPVDCQERERLNAIYLTVISKHSEAKRYLVDPHSEEWQEATAESRRECYTALAALNAHRQEHGC